MVHLSHFFDLKSSDKYIKFSSTPWVKDGLEIKNIKDKLKDKLLSSETWTYTEKFEKLAKLYLNMFGGRS